MKSRATKRAEVRAVKITRRNYLTVKALATGCGVFMAAEAVASTAIEHPEWDMEEKRTWDEWEKGA